MNPAILFLWVASTWIAPAQQGTITFHMAPGPVAICDVTADNKVRNCKLQNGMTVTQLVQLWMDQVDRDRKSHQEQGEEQRERIRAYIEAESRLQRHYEKIIAAQNELLCIDGHKAFCDRTARKGGEAIDKLPTKYSDIPANVKDVCAHGVATDAMGPDQHWYNCADVRKLRD